MKSLFWAGILLFVGSTYLAIDKIQDIKVQNEGTLVKMRIEKLPRSCLGTKLEPDFVMSILLGNILI